MRVEQLSASTTIPEEVQFTEIFVCQDSLNRPGVANYFVLCISEAYNKRYINPQHLTDTSDSGPDLERAANSNLNEL